MKKISDLAVFSLDKHLLDPEDSIKLVIINQNSGAGDVGDGVGGSRGGGGPGVVGSGFRSGKSWVRGSGVCLLTQRLQSANRYFK